MSIVHGEVSVSQISHFLYQCPVKMERFGVLSFKCVSFFFFVGSKAAKAGARCDYAVYCGASASNAERVSELAPLVAGLKMYLNETFSTLRLDDMSVWLEVTLTLLVHCAHILHSCRYHYCCLNRPKTS